jgi:peptide/nickel transport system permease protein
VSLPPVDGVALASTGPAGDESASKADEFVGRSPGQLAWARLCRDRTAMISGGTLVAFLVLALSAPLIEMLYGVGPNEQFQRDLDGYGMPLGYAGGISGKHWFGLEPGLGRDIFIRMIYGMRTSLFIALAAAVVTAASGILAGMLAGYLGGWVDGVIN